LAVQQLVVVELERLALVVLRIQQAALLAAEAVAAQVQLA
jgi:hypothetical protein